MKTASFSLLEKGGMLLRGAENKIRLGAKKTTLFQGAAPVMVALI